ncbi:unnamed protein product (macronuclear) [Paramecium tetraurelia]|uniref:Uncharacterized protein n=1 Tax=Paramecium tetraurelia TaxID=5888 RepID=A0BFT5_PARTE|nr:uncharacterized protein GSPATT00028437001 [Paramecium tetraurelia]CAK57402.1 unnamed protein product [Paramecium tetraurelia]|eukprot:XP_001424800.1 hypothetical protein (macronuclear) [Paramecium tetraurelia strain d4-2]
MDMPEKIKSYKVTFDGNTAVGKTHLFNRFWLYFIKLKTLNQPSIGIEYDQKKYQVSNNQTVNLLYWDTTGQERYRQVVLDHQQKAKGVYLVYDITKSQLLMNQKIGRQCCFYHVNWQQIDKVADNNKSREVSLEKAQKFAEMHKLIFMEVSVYSDEDIEKCQTRMVEGNTCIIIQKFIIPYQQIQNYFLIQFFNMFTQNQILLNCKLTKYIQILNFDSRLQYKQIQ